MKELDAITLYEQDIIEDIHHAVEELKSGQDESAFGRMATVYNFVRFSGFIAISKVFSEMLENRHDMDDRKRNVFIRALEKTIEVILYIKGSGKEYGVYLFDEYRALREFSGKKSHPSHLYVAQRNVPPIGNYSCKRSMDESRLNELKARTDDFVSEWLSVPRKSLTRPFVNFIDELLSARVIEDRDYNAWYLFKIFLEKGMDQDLFGDHERLIVENGKKLAKATYEKTGDHGAFISTLIFYYVGMDAGTLESLVNDPELSEIFKAYDVVETKAFVIRFQNSNGILVDDIKMEPIRFRVSKMINAWDSVSKKRTTLEHFRQSISSAEQEIRKLKNPVLTSMATNLITLVGYAISQRIVLTHDLWREIGNMMTIISKGLEQRGLTGPEFDEGSKTIMARIGILCNNPGQVVLPMIDRKMLMLDRENLNNKRSVIHHMKTDFMAVSARIESVLKAGNNDAGSAKANQEIIELEKAPGALFIIKEDGFARFIQDYCSKARDFLVNGLNTSVEELIFDTARIMLFMSFYEDGMHNAYDVLGVQHDSSKNTGNSSANPSVSGYTQNIDLPQMTLHNTALNAAHDAPSVSSMSSAQATVEDSGNGENSTISGTSTAMDAQMSGSAGLEAVHAEHGQMDILGESISQKMERPEFITINPFVAGTTRSADEVLADIEGAVEEIGEHRDTINGLITPDTLERGFSEEDFSTIRHLLHQTKGLFAWYDPDGTVGTLLNQSENAFLSPASEGASIDAQNVRRAAALIDGLISSLKVSAQEGEAELGADWITLVYELVDYGKNTLDAMMDKDMDGSMAAEDKQEEPMGHGEQEPIQTESRPDSSEVPDGSEVSAEHPPISLPEHEHQIFQPGPDTLGVNPDNTSDDTVSSHPYPSESLNEPEKEDSGEALNSGFAGNETMWDMGQEKSDFLHNLEQVSNYLSQGLDSSPGNRWALMITRKAIADVEKKETISMMTLKTIHDYLGKKVFSLVRSGRADEITKASLSEAKSDISLIVSLDEDIHVNSATSQGATQEVQTPPESLDLSEIPDEAPQAIAQPETQQEQQADQQTEQPEKTGMPYQTGNPSDTIPETSHGAIEEKESPADDVVHASTEPEQNVDGAESVESGISSMDNTPVVDLSHEQPSPDTPADEDLNFPTATALMVSGDSPDAAEVGPGKEDGQKTAQVSKDDTLDELTQYLFEMIGIYRESLERAHQRENALLDFISTQEQLEIQHAKERREKLSQLMFQFQDSVTMRLGAIDSLTEKISTLIDRRER